MLQIGLGNAQRPEVVPHCIAFHAPSLEGEGQASGLAAAGTPLPPPDALAAESLAQVSSYCSPAWKALCWGCVRAARFGQQRTWKPHAAGQAAAT